VTVFCTFTVNLILVYEIKEYSYFPYDSCTYTMWLWWISKYFSKSMAVANVRLWNWNAAHSYSPRQWISHHARRESCWARPFMTYYVCLAAMQRRLELPGHRYSTQRCQEDSIGIYITAPVHRQKVTAPVKISWQPDKHKDARPKKKSRDKPGDKREPFRYRRLFFTHWFTIRYKKCAFVDFLLSSAQ